MYSDDLDDYSPDSSGEILYRVITEEDSLLDRLKEIEPLVLKVIRSDEQLFKAGGRKRGGPEFQATPMGKKLLVALKSGQAEFHCYFPLHDLNPYVDLLFKCADKVDGWLLHSCTATLIRSEVSKGVEVLNGLVEDLRHQASGEEFKSIIKKFVKTERKRVQSLDRYIDALFDRHSRLVVIRLDLTYGGQSFNGCSDVQERLEQVKKDWAKMQRDLYKGVPVKGMRGFACKLEYGHLKGFHFHLLLFYDGAMHRQDVDLARLIGEHWVNEVTHGRGRYYNCNKKKLTYPFPGIGVITRLELSRISNLKYKVAVYLTKIDYWLRFSTDSGRSFFRGNMPKVKGVKRGRPRKLMDSEESNPFSC